MQVILLGNVSVFERDGIYQIYTYMEPFGAGRTLCLFGKTEGGIRKKRAFSKKSANDRSHVPTKNRPSHFKKRCCHKGHYIGGQEALPEIAIRIGRLQGSRRRKQDIVDKHRNSK